MGACGVACVVAPHVVVACVVAPHVEDVACGVAPHVEDVACGVAPHVVVACGVAPLVEGVAPLVDGVAPHVVVACVVDWGSGCRCVVILGFVLTAAGAGSAAALTRQVCVDSVGSGFSPLGASAGG